MECGLQFEDVCYRVSLGFGRGSKEILKNLSGNFRGGKLTAILGPSGSGKTSLLNVLSGFATANAGRIRVDGQPPKPEAFRKMCSYIAQENRLQDLLTLHENLDLVHDLTFSPENPRKEILIDEVIKTLRLEQVRETRISKLSGGEKKRLSIGLELIRNPAVIFIDEPTTGLDVKSSFEVMKYLKELTRQKKTIICTIHQPSASIFQDFDEIYVLAAGNCLYQGGCGEMLGFLDARGFTCPLFHNPADFVLEVASSDANDERIAKILHESRRPRSPDLVRIPPKQEAETPPTIPQPEATPSRQLTVLLKREYLKSKRNPTLTYLRLVTSVTNSLALSSIFWDVGGDASTIWFSYNAILGFVLHLMMPSLMLTILTFPCERKVLQLEHFNGLYSLKSFFAALTLIELPVAFVYCLVSNLIVYSLTSQPWDLWRFATFSTLGFLVCLVAQSLGLLIGSIFDIVNGTFFGSAISCFMMIFGGFCVNFCDVPTPLRWLTTLSYLRYGVEGMVGAVYGYQREKLDCKIQDFCYYKYSTKFLHDLGVQGERVGVDLLVLTCAFVFLRVVTLLTLQRKLRKVE